MTAPPPPGWYPDPSGSPAQRWWDGNQWTNHTQGGAAPPPPAQHNNPDGGRYELGFGHNPDTDKIRAQAGKITGESAQSRGGGTLFTEPVLVVNQKAKFIEVANEYQVFDQAGQQLGSVVQVGQSTFKKVMRFVGNYDQFFTHKLEVRDNNHNILMRLTRPAKFVKSRVIVERGDGTHLGEITQDNVFGKIRFSFVVNDQKIGGINAENWRAWNFALVDHNEQEIGKITKTWGGFAKAMFTTADNYVVQIHRPLQDPLASMVVASALTVDTALKQDEGN